MIYFFCTPPDGKGGTQGGGGGKTCYLLVLNVSKCDKKGKLHPLHVGKCNK